MCHDKYMKLQVSREWPCDACIAEEVVSLMQRGVHVLDACCGHGVEKPWAIIAGGQSKEIVVNLGYSCAAVPSTRLTKIQLVGGMDTVGCVS